MRKSNKICCLLNFAPHYREEIYLKMEKELKTTFYFGDIENGNIKKMDYNLFSTKITELHTIKLFSHFVFIKNSLSLVFKPYSKYIITGEYYNLSTWYIMAFNKALGKETFLWTHGWYGNENFFKRIIKKTYFSLASGIFLYGDYAKNLMIGEGFSDKDLHVIYNSLDYEKQLEIRNNLIAKPIYTNIFKNSNPVIIFTGRITKVKKLEMLLEAQRQMLDANNPINLFILGDGPELKNLKLHAEKLGIIKEIYFYGPCYEEKVIADFYYNANLCVSPGNVGLTGIHAMSYGCPVISHDNFQEQMPEFEVVINEHTGYFFQQDNVNDLIMKISKVLKMDRNKLRNNCFDIVDSKFNTRHQMTVFKSILNS